MRREAIDEALLNGEYGRACAFAMRLLEHFGAAMGAERFIDIAGAHIDGCLYHGQVSLDFVDKLVELGGKVRVPTTLNVGTLDLLHPELFQGSQMLRQAGRRLMEAHVKLGCQPSFTCAPYQLAKRPGFGEQIAWGESNAIVFANSVLGARTHRYGDFVDLCAALTGRVPYQGLHVPENRRARLLVTLDSLPDIDKNALAIAVGHIVGSQCAGAVPVILGLPTDLNEDDLKGLGAVGASSGALALFHAVGLTPEAPDLATALQGAPADRLIAISKADILTALNGLSTAAEGVPLSAVSLGTPHFSLREFDRLLALLPHFKPNPDVEFYVNTGRGVHAILAARGDVERLEAAGITILVDTCVYVSSVLRRERKGAVMTNSGKFARYAPGNLDLEVAFGSLADCLLSAEAGRVIRSFA